MKQIDKYNKFLKYVCAFLSCPAFRAMRQAGEPRLAAQLPGKPAQAQAACPRSRRVPIPPVRPLGRADGEWTELLKIFISIDKC